MRWTARLYSAGLLLGLLLPLVPQPAEAQLAGHGGPVRALVVSSDGDTALSGAFDASAILWSLGRNVALQVLRAHEGAVNAVAILPDGRLATAGEDARIALWTPGRPAPDRVLEGHRGPGLAVSPDGAMLASASWDRTLRLWRLEDGAASALEGHRQNVNGVAFTPDGKAVVSAGYDATVRIWPLDGGAPVVATLPAPLSAVAIAPDSEIIAAGADGRMYFLSPAAELRATVEAASTPLTALSISPNGKLVAAATIGGETVIVARQTRMIARSLGMHGKPVWAAAFLPDNRTLLTGGTDRLIRRWDATTGTAIDVGTAALADPLARYQADPGAQVFRTCVACHALQPDDGNRAGPSLHGLFGRRIATLPGYNYSPALRRLDIVWTPATVAELFEVGPAQFTPGTKMPEQRIGAPEDREALVKFLERATK